MNTQHTPGPWTAQGHDGPISIVSLESEPQQVIAQMIVRGSPTIRRTAKANARLIAAAPDLLAALKEGVEIVNYREHAFGEPEVELADYLKDLHDWLNQAIPAIAKAEEGS